MNCAANPEGTLQGSSRYVVWCENIVKGYELILFLEYLMHNNDIDHIATLNHGYPPADYWATIQEIRCLE